MNCVTGHSRLKGLYCSTAVNGEKLFSPMGFFFWCSTSSSHWEKLAGRHVASLLSSTCNTSMIKTWLIFTQYTLASHWKHRVSQYDDMTGCPAAWLTSKAFLHYYPVTYSLTVNNKSPYWVSSDALMIKRITRWVSVSPHRVSLSSQGDTRRSEKPSVGFPVGDTHRCTSLRWAPPTCWCCWYRWWMWWDSWLSLVCSLRGENATRVAKTIKGAHARKESSIKTAGALATSNETISHKSAAIRPGFFFQLNIYVCIQCERDRE